MKTRLEGADPRRLDLDGVCGALGHYVVEEVAGGDLELRHRGGGPVFKVASARFRAELLARGSQTPLQVLEAILPALCPGCGRRGDPAMCPQCRRRQVADLLRIARS